MKVTCQDCQGTGYVKSTSKRGGEGLYRCGACRTAGYILLHPMTVREVLRNVANAYDAPVQP